MNRFFVCNDQIQDQSVTLRGDDFHHLAKVLRKKTGDLIQVINGKGEEFSAQISVVQVDFIIAEIIGRVERSTESKLKITLTQSLPKADKFEWILQKNTELGVSSFQPVLSERSTIKLDRRAIATKMDRWRKIIHEAAEQSGRQFIPVLEPVLDWGEMLRQLPPGLILIPWEGERGQSLKEVLTAQTILPSQVTVLIGPEGGFSLAEVEKSRAAGAVPVTLGPRIFRTETAGLVVATAILYHFNEMG